MSEKAHGGNHGEGGEKNRFWRTVKLVFGALLFTLTAGIVSSKVNGGDEKHH